METNRLEAFSDGVLAIIITIMVLELRVPHGSDWAAIEPLLPVFLSYVLSFIYLGIYWNNHHHLLKAGRKMSAGIMWTNLHLLFWLSLFPFVTGWMGENHFTAVPSALYGRVLLMAAIAYFILQNLIIKAHGRASRLAQAMGTDMKGKLSPLLYARHRCFLLSSLDRRLHLHLGRSNLARPRSAARTRTEVTLSSSARAQTECCPPDL